MVDPIGMLGGKFTVVALVNRLFRSRTISGLRFCSSFSFLFHWFIFVGYFFFLFDFCRFCWLCWIVAFGLIKDYVFVNISHVLFQMTTFSVSIVTFCAFEYPPFVNYSSMPHKISPGWIRFVTIRAFEFMLRCRLRNSSFLFDICRRCWIVVFVVRFLFIFLSSGKNNVITYI